MDDAMSGGRIRTIKPELLEDEKTASLGHLEFRIFIAMILLADDYGNLRGEASLLRAHALWGSEQDAAPVAAALQRLVEDGLAREYCVRGQSYLHICGWTKHQRIDKPGKPRVPGPDDPEMVRSRRWATYFLRLGEDGPIKIGKTLDVEKRIVQLQTSAPAKLNLVAVLHQDIEAECHRRFARHRSHGEWFHPDVELLKFIEEVGFANDSRTIREWFSESFATDQDQGHGRGTGPGTGPGPLAAAELRPTEDTSSASPPTTAAKKKSSEPKGIRIPLGWQPSKQTIEHFNGRGFDPLPSLDVFRDYWLGRAGEKGRKADWEATFRNWIRREIDQGNASTYYPPPKRRESSPSDAASPPQSPPVAMAPAQRAVLDALLDGLVANKCVGE